jgi:hypothetical protein
VWESRAQVNKACGTDAADVTTFRARLYAPLRSCNQTNWIDQATCPNWWYAVMPCCLLLWNTPASHQAEEQLVNRSGLEGVAPSTNISIHGMLICHFPRRYTVLNINTCDWAGWYSYSTRFVIERLPFRISTFLIVFFCTTPAGGDQHNTLTWTTITSLQVLTNPQFINNFMRR